ncbi:hypothetical protein HJG60_010245 [Phyllostomus discolor]|uniref:Uncharacterized protein n=1 Tax=Phyllostomus discolor TaxID=89673 RepID=A0A834ASF7_9CHIR|nr:hypothetical protein HJG60_010245 [Phyllostomus discolor]
MMRYNAVAGSLGSKRQPAWFQILALSLPAVCLGQVPVGPEPPPLSLGSSGGIDSTYFAVRPDVKVSVSAWTWPQRSASVSCYNCCRGRSSGCRPPLTCQQMSVPDPEWQAQYRVMERHVTGPAKRTGGNRETLGVSE